MKECRRRVDVFEPTQVITSVKNVENFRTIANLGPLPKDKSLWPSNYRLEADVTPELATTKASY